jgi:hypothetical protein
VRPLLLRILAGAAALLVAALGLSACDNSPYAVSVNSQVLKVAGLNAELGDWAGNPTYVSWFDQTNSSSNGGSGTTVAGDAKGTYSTAWVAQILNQVVVSDVISQHLSSTNALPDEGLVDAARSLSEFASPYDFTQFPPAFRQVLVERLADEAAITPVTTAVATLLKTYQQYQEYFFSQICVNQSAAFSQQAAQALVTAGVPNGAQVCYSQAQFENQSQAYRNAVIKLGVGQVSTPIPTGFGYEVAKVTSRSDQGFTQPVKQVIAYALQQTQANPVLTSLITKAHVKVNPAYGTWSSTSGVNPPALASQ